MERNVQVLIDYNVTRMLKAITITAMKYTNLCVKAEPMSLMAVVVDTPSGKQKIERCVDVSIPEWNQLLLFMKRPDYMAMVLQAVRQIHPEFKVEKKKAYAYHGQLDPEDVLLYTMPAVDKNRRDVLNQGVDLLKKQTNAKIDRIKAECTVQLTQKVADPDKKKEALDFLDEKTQELKDQFDQVTANKLKEIEDAYEKYIAEHPDGDSSSNDAGADEQTTQSYDFNNSDNQDANQPEEEENDGQSYAMPEAQQQDSDNGSSDNDDDWETTQTFDMESWKN